MAQQPEIALNVERFHPEVGPEPYVQQYRVPVGEGMMVLDALNFVRDELDPSLGLSAGPAVWVSAGVVG